MPHKAKLTHCSFILLSDDDIKKLVLWCALPVSDMDDDLVVEGKALQLQPQLPSSSTKTEKPAKVKPVMVSRDARSILDANDTQMYCLLPLSFSDRKRKPTISSRDDKRKAKAKQRESREAGSDDEAEGDEDERRELVVFQFNQYVYHGELWICPTLLDDLAKLSTHVFPHLRAQSHSLAFYGETEDLLLIRPTEDDAGPLDKMAQFAGIRHRFEKLAPTLLTLLMDSHTWIQDFLTEVDTIVAAEDSASSSSSPISSEWLASHLKAWLEVDDGMEAFFELELGCDPLAQSVFGDFDEAQVELVVWKGIVNAAIMVVVYRNGSFYMMLRDQPSEGDPLQIQDAEELFGAIPMLGSKGRGYLVRKFPSEIQRNSQRWLAGAKLLLWQTSASLVREELREAQAKEKHRSSKKQQTLCADWFEEDEAGSAASEVKAAQAKHVSSSTDTLREAERTEEKSQQQRTSGAKAHRESAKASAPLTMDKVSRRHHIPPLSSAHAAPVKITTTAPWDLRTGRPL